MIIRVRTLAGVTFKVVVSENATIMDIKKKLPTPPSYIKNISLFYKGTELLNVASFQQLGFSEGDFLVVVFNKKRHREGKEKVTSKVSELPRRTMRITSTDGLNTEEPSLSNVRKRVRLRVGNKASAASAASTDFWKRTLDAVSSGSGSGSGSDSDQDGKLSQIPSAAIFEEDLDFGETENLVQIEPDLSRLSSDTSSIAASVGRVLGLTTELVEDKQKQKDDLRRNTQALLERLRRRTGANRVGSSSGVGTGSVEHKVVKVDEDKLNQLTAMGFQRPAAIRALLFHRHNIEASVMWLLENAGSSKINEPITSEEMSLLSTPLLAFGGNNGNRNSLSSPTDLPGYAVRTVGRGRQQNRVGDPTSYLENIKTMQQTHSQSQTHHHLSVQMQAVAQAARSQLQSPSTTTSLSSDFS